MSLLKTILSDDGLSAYILNIYSTLVFFDILIHV